MSLERLSASVWRLELPSRTMPPFTSTNSYLIAQQGVAALVDPGFSGEDRESLAALRAGLAAVDATLLKAVLLTHTHGDHREGLRTVLAEFESPAVYVHPLEMARVPEVEPRGMGDGRVLTVGGCLVRALHTPGHSPGHLSFHLPEEGSLLAGDLVAGRGSVWVGLPEGDVADYLASLERLLALPDLERLGPGHGPQVEEPYRRLADTRSHRLEREKQVLESVSLPRSLAELRQVVYGDLPDALCAAAEASLLAHLRKLMNEMRVVHLGDDQSGPFVVRT
jgi:ribonuclease/clavin/mitogillin